MGIFLIISGSVLYVYSKSSPSASPSQSAEKSIDGRERGVTEPFLSSRPHADLEKGER
jgi:hypothetical protein